MRHSDNSLECGSPWRRFRHAIRYALWMSLACAVAQGRADESPVERAPVPETARLADEYIRQFERLQRLSLGNELLQAEVRNVATSQQAGAGDTALLDLIATVEDPESRRILTQILSENFRPALDPLRALEARVDRDLQTTRAAWLTTRANLHLRQVQVFTAEAQNRVAGRLAVLLNIDNLWLWLTGALAIGTLLTLYLIDCRHPLRRMFWVQRRRLWLLRLAALGLLAIPLVPAGLLLVFGGRPYESLLRLGSNDAVPPRERWTQEIEGLQNEVVAKRLEPQQAELRRQLQQARDAELRGSGPSASEGAHLLLERWHAARDQLHTALINVSIQKGMAEAWQQDLATYEALAADLDQHHAALASAEWMNKLAAGGIGTLLLSLTGALGFWMVRNTAARQRLLAKTCPQCLAVGKLVPVSDGSNRGRLGLEELRCTNIIRDDPYEECEFTFNAAYTDRIKVGFPTLGVASSGKSHWMSMVYRELNRGRYPSTVHFEKVKSRGSEQFDSMVDQILNARMRVQATQSLRLPDPLIFSFRDNDRLQRSHVLVSLFDYAGQVTVDERNYHRRRALDGDGFLFFLDPTKPSDTQADALVNFREDLKLVKGLRAGQQIHTPVALCVSKLDLLVNEDYAQGSDLIYDFYRQLRDVDAGSREMSLAQLDRRSALISELRDTIWPGWNIERQIHDLFGGRYMFFPMTPVSLNENELGVTELSQRTIAPYGILEPLMWLLHMNGHPVLE